MAVDWSKCSKEDFKVIRKIVDRVWKTDHGSGDKLNLIMDIEATHISRPLRLKELLEADDANFFHDINGIMRFIDRDTGELTGCFSPRFTAPARSLSEDMVIFTRELLEDTPCTT